MVKDYKQTRLIFEGVPMTERASKAYTKAESEDNLAGSFKMVNDEMSVREKRQHKARANRIYRRENLRHSLVL